MADALLSTPVAIGGAVVATVLIATAGAKLKKSGESNLIPLMGVMGAFIFAAQMINFAIPGTGSSGHIVGGVLLAAFLGPWAGFLTLTSVLIIQCLVFADGGLMALGCNILNMAAVSTLIAYPFIFKPLAGNCKSVGRVVGASLAACIVGLELGAFLVSIETELSGVTALPFGAFFALMGSIHLAIGLGEGLATAAILSYVVKVRPSLLKNEKETTPPRSMKRTLIAFAVGALLLGGGLAFYASSDPDGLEWSIQKMTGSSELPAHEPLAAKAAKVQNATAVLPDYENVLSGVAGSAMVVAVVWAFSAMLIRKKA